MLAGFSIAVLSEISPFRGLVSSQKYLNVFRCSVFSCSSPYVWARVSSVRSCRLELHGLNQRLCEPGTVGGMGLVGGGIGDGSGSGPVSGNGEGSGSGVVQGNGSARCGVDWFHQLLA